MDEEDLDLIQFSKQDIINSIEIFAIDIGTIYPEETAEWIRKNLTTYNNIKNL
jgi:hypothetical protein